MAGNEMDLLKQATQTLMSSRYDGEYCSLRSYSTLQAAHNCCFGAFTRGVDNATIVCTDSPPWAVLLSLSPQTHSKRSSSHMLFNVKSTSRLAKRGGVPHCTTYTALAGLSRRQSVTGTGFQKGPEETTRRFFCGPAPNERIFMIIEH